MKRLFTYITIIAALCIGAGCEKAEHLPKGSFTIVSGIDKNALTLPGDAGGSTSLYISSKYPWTISKVNGVTFSPSSGKAGVNMAIMAIADQCNNSLDKVKLGNIVFTVEHTRYVGVEAWQESVIKFDEGRPQRIYINANEGAQNTLGFKCALNYIGDIELKSSGEIESTLTAVSQMHHEVSVKALQANTSISERKIGSIEFVLDGPQKNSTIEVWQRAAIQTNCESILLGGNKGESEIISVTSPFNINISTTSDSFTTSFDKDGNIVVTATADSTSEQRELLGEVVISLLDDPDCKTSVEVWQRPAKAPRCVMFYLLGTALKSYFEQNIDATVKSLNRELLGNSRIVYFIQDGTYSGGFYELLYDEKSQRIVKHQFADTTLPTTYTTEMFTDIIKTMADYAPAQEYGLIVGSHGKGWIPKHIAASTLEAERYQRLWAPVPGAALVRHIGDREVTQLDTEEVAEAIVASGIKPEYIIFDVCYMSNIESLYDLRNATNYILASPVEVMAKGMPYDLIIPQLITNVDTRSTLDAAAKAFVESYKATGNSIFASACSAVTVCSELEALAEVTKRTNQSLDESIDHTTLQHYDGISSSNNPTHIFYDFEDFVLNSCTDTAAREAFVEQLNRTILSRYHTDSFYSTYSGSTTPIQHYSGVSTSAPITLDSASAYIEEWKATAWYQATH